MSKSVKSRSRLSLFLAVALGLAAAVATYFYVDTTTRQAQNIPMAIVVVARSDIPAKVRLTPEMLTTRQVPLDTKHPAALGSISEVDGKTTAVPLTSGEQVLNTKFKSEKQLEEKLSLAQLIPPGYRAIAVTFNEVIGTGGLIVPGDRVDVIAIFDAKTMPTDSAMIILQDLQVLAVAQAIQGDEEMPVQGNGPVVQTARASNPLGGASSNSAQAAASKSDGQSARASVDGAEKATARPQAKSATLAVTPEQAQRLALAEATGKLRMILRPAKDSAIVELPEATLSRIKGSPEKPIASGR